MCRHVTTSTVGAGMRSSFGPMPGETSEVSRGTSVGGVGAPGASGVRGGGEEPVQARPNEGIEKAKSLVRDLDVLLARAAESATKGVDVGAVKKALKDVNISWSNRRALNSAASKADAAFKAINGFTGRELAKAVVVKDGKFDWDLGNPAGAAIKKALDAQAELSEKLLQIVTQTHAGSASPVLEEAMLQCDRRSSEIHTLVMQFADILEKGEPDDSAVKERLDSTLERLLPRQALEMHGNDTALAAMKAAVEPLAQRLEPGKSFTSEEVAAIHGEIDTMSNALDAAVKRGVVGGRGVGVDRTLFAAAKDILGEVRDKLATAKRDISKASIMTFVDHSFAPVPGKAFDLKFVPLLKSIAPDMAGLVEQRDALHKAAKKYASEPNSTNFSELKAQAKGCSGRSDSIQYELGQLCRRCLVSSDGAGTTPRALKTPEAVRKDLADLIRENKALSADEREACLALVPEFANLLREFVDAIIHDHNDSSGIGKIVNMAKFSADGVLSQVVHLEQMHRTAESMGDAQFVTSDTVRAAFEGKLRLTTIVEARLHGLRDDDVNPGLDDVNVVSSEKHGSGSFNTVYEVGYKDGSTFIFKPEAAGRQMFDDQVLAQGTEKAQMVAQLNIASQKTADALGLGDVMVKTAVGTHEGEFGIFMEKAKGVGAAEFQETGSSRSAPKGDLSVRQIQEDLDDGTYAQIVGGLMRKANRLDWFDMITGQGDRHPHNFMVSVGEDYSVSLKGIDNDASFPAYRTGIRTFSLDRKMAHEFANAMRAVAQKLYGFTHESAELYEQLRQDPGLSGLFKDGTETVIDDGTAKVDATKFKSPILHCCLEAVFGVKTTALPDYIDKDLYDNLMALAEPGERRDKYIADLTAHLPTDARDAAIQRLDEAIAHAKVLNEKGHVVNEAEWSMKDKQREIAGRIQRDNEVSHYIPDGFRTPFMSKEVEGVVTTVDLLTSGYFRRDLLRAVAKPGWFD